MCFIFVMNKLSFFDFALTSMGGCSL